MPEELGPEESTGLTSRASMPEAGVVAAAPAASRTDAQRSLSPCHLATAQPTTPDRRGASDDGHRG